MEVLAIGFMVGVGVTLAAKRGMPRVKHAIEWSARQAGWVAARAAAAVEDTRRSVREQYARGRSSKSDPANGVSRTDNADVPVQDQPQP